MTDPDTQLKQQAHQELTSRREGFLLGSLIGSALASRSFGCGDAAAVLATIPAGSLPLPLLSGGRSPATALPDALLEELLSGGVDLQRLGRHWVQWWDDGGEPDPRLSLSLSHLKEFDAPLPPPVAPTIASMVAVLPAALTGGASPQAMLRGAFHVASMLDPSEEGVLSAAAIAVAGWRTLEGHRDFLPEVLAALKANDPPAGMMEAIRAIPRDPRRPPPVPRGDDADVVVALTWILWIAHHRPRPVEEMEKMARLGGVSPMVGAVLGALLGARNGVADWPAEWLDAVAPEADFRRSALAAMGAG